MYFWNVNMKFIKCILQFLTLDAAEAYCMFVFLSTFLFLEKLYSVAKKDIPSLLH